MLDGFAQLNLLNSIRERLRFQDICINQERVVRFSTFPFKLTSIIVAMLLTRGVSNMVVQQGIKNRFKCLIANKKLYIVPLFYFGQRADQHKNVEAAHMDRRK